MFKAFEGAVARMSEGERRTIRIPAAHAFGAYDESLLFRIPRSSLQPNAPAEEGVCLSIVTVLGKVDARVASSDDSEVVIDANHELAGRDLAYEVEVVATIRESAIECEPHSASCSCGCHKLKESLAC